VPEEPGGEQPSSADQDDSTEVVHAKAERLDRSVSKDLVHHGESALMGEVAAMRQQLRNQRRMMLLGGSFVVVLFLATLVAISSSADSSTATPSTSTVTVTTTPSTTSSTVSTTPEVSLPPTTTDLPPSSSVVPPPTTTAVPAVGPIPEVHLSGQYAILDGYGFDFDDGDQSETYGDIVHDGQTVTSTNGAVIANGVAHPTEYGRCATVPDNAYRTHIGFAEFSANPVLCVRTSGERLAYLELTSFPTSNGGDRMSFRWTTWRK
jgi:hypothetical protein